MQQQNLNEFHYFDAYIVVADITKRRKKNRMALSKHTFDMHMRRNIKRSVRTEIDSAKRIDSLFLLPLAIVIYRFFVGYFYDAWAYKPSPSLLFVPLTSF